MNRLIVAILMLVASALSNICVAIAACEKSTGWPEWQAFRRDLIRPEGRVVDLSDSRHITTSEGQSYALFFALVDNDPVLFRQLLRWTERNLSEGDLTAKLPAWLWGRDTSGNWGVLDDNTASDSNLWIAYSLLEAGRLWQEHSYSVLGNLMLQRMAKEELVSAPGLGTVLLPGQRGFVTASGIRLNPSYVPPQLVARAHDALPGSAWRELMHSTPQFLIASSPLGLAPDWIDWEEGKPQFDRTGQLGSYNAIRVYLWIGMLHPDAADATRLTEHFRQAMTYLDVQGLPAEEVNVLDGSARSPGPVGFSAALLPLFSNTGFGERQRERLGPEALQKAGYYSRILALFGTGWDQQRYSFDPSGRLVPAWKDCR